MSNIDRLAALRAARSASVCKGSWLSMALGLAQMVLDVQANLKPIQSYMLNNLCFNNFSKKSIPGDVRAQVLQVPVGASHGDQGRKSGKVSIRC